MRFFLTAAATLLLSTGLATAGEKGMMHCFAFTVIESATDADWKAFNEATDQWPSKFKGIQKIWHGKLRSPLAQFTVSAEARKKLAAGEKDVDTKANRLVRQHGVCMLMTGPEALKEYTANPFHKEWMAKYEKVRVAGTTTYDILAQ
jgi:leucyl-tRNA synthetase